MGATPDGNQGSGERTLAGGTYSPEYNGTGRVNHRPPASARDGQLVLSLGKTYEILGDRAAVTDSCSFLGASILANLEPPGARGFFPLPKDMSILLCYKYSGVVSITIFLPSRHRLHLV